MNCAVHIAEGSVHCPVEYSNSSIVSRMNILTIREAELDEIWSFVGHKGNPRWLWHAIDHHTGKVLAFVFGRRKDEVFLQLKTLLEPFGLTRCYTDHVRRESSR